MRAGRCTCGGVTYEVEGEPIVVAHCHCTDCQRISGAGHATGAMFPSEKLTVRGEVAEFCLRSEESTVTRTFCPKCGSPLFGRNSRMLGFTTISVGTLNDPNSVTPQVVIFTRSQPHWDVMDSALQRFDTQPAWRPRDGA